MMRSTEYCFLACPFALMAWSFAVSAQEWRSYGGANWSGASFDPITHYLFVNVNELGSIGAMKPQPAGKPVRYRRTSKFGEYARFWDSPHLPCQQPPWGILKAINVDTGEIAWKVPLGSLPGLAVNTGTPNLGGSIVTGGLVFIGGTTDSRFRAFDARTGAELWSATLEANAHATPMTYALKKNNRQFVVIAVGGGNFSTTVADTLVAFALPDH
jgi:glucose dehydrogenase